MNPAKQHHVETECTAEEEPLKMLGALVPESLHWQFKAAASARKEQMQEAIMHAALMYISVAPTPADMKGDK